LGDQTPGSPVLEGTHPTDAIEIWCSILVLGDRMNHFKKRKITELF